MVEEYNKPEYKPYPSTSPQREEDVGDAYDYNVDELINRLSYALNTVREHIQVTREDAAGKALMNTERDELMNLSVNSVWDGGTELPLLVYEVVGKSQNARHQYIADVALEASRGVSGNYCLDRLDLFKMLEAEMSAMLEYLKTVSDNTPTLIPMYDAVWNIEQIVAKIPESLVYKRIHLNYYAPNREEPNEVIKASQIQKSIHGQVAILNSSLTSNKQDVIEISKTADTFYKEKIASLSTPYTPDVNKATTLITNRATLLEYAAMNMLKIFSAGNSLKQTWEEQSVTSGISIPHVAQQAYISNNPKNLASGTQALVDFAAEISEPLYDASMLFVRKQGYTKEDAIALVDMLNSLPETHTYISAGIINVRAQPEFVHALIDQINNMPPNSTLISGGMIALVGGKTLSEFQDEVESGQYSGGIADVQQVIDVLNGTLGEGYDGLTILLPGVIGLTGNEGIREAIVDAINNFGTGTLIGPGAILISGGDSLADKAGVWDDAAADASQAAADALQAMQDAANAITLVDHEIVGFYQDEEPSVGMEFGDIWIDTDDTPVDSSSIYRYEDEDGGSTGTLDWRPAPTNGIGLVYLEAYGAQATADGKITSYFQDNAPSSPAVGDLWIDTNDDNKLYRWDGAEWDLARDAGITTALQDAADALEDAAAAIEILDGQIVGWYQDSEPTIGGSPAGAKYGDIWIDTDDSPVDESSIYRCENSSGGHSGILGWYSASDNAIGLAYLAAYDAQSTADGKIVTFYQTSEPTAAAIGDLWVDTDDNNILHRWDGDSWVDIRDSGISQALQDAGDALEDAAAALAIADGEIVGWYTASAPAIGGSPNQAKFGDIWIDIDDSPLDSSSIYRCEDITGGSQGTLDWRSASTNAIGLVYLEAYDAQTTADGKIVTFYQTEEPTAMAIGDLWVDTNDDNRLHRWSGTDWIDVRDAGIAAALQDASDALEDAAAALEIADGEIVGWYQATEPDIGGSPSQAKFGDIWIDIDDSPLDSSSVYRCEDINGGSSGTLGWYSASTNAIGLAYLAAYDAQTTADGKIKTFYAASAPTAEGVGDLWIDTDDGNRLYRWSGSQWVDIQDEDIATALANASTALEAADGLITGWYQDEEPAIGGSPAGASFGDIWIDTNYAGFPTDDAVFRCEDENGGSQGTLDWYPAPTSAIGLAYLAAYDALTTADGKINTFYDASEPTAGAVGDLWIDTDDDNRLYRWSGASWVDVRDAGIETALQDAADALEVADGEIIGWYQDTEPAIGGSPGQATFGDIWIDTDDTPVDSSSIYRCEDASGGSSGTLGWHAASTNAIGLAFLAAYDAQATADGKIVTFYEDDSPGPSNPAVGDLWIDTTGSINRLHRWSGTEWIDVQDADIAQALEDAGQALSDAAAAIEVADGEIVGWYQTSAPVIGGSPDQAHFGDIWIDTNYSGFPTPNAIYRCQDASGGSQGTLDWYQTPTNAIGLVYLAAYEAQTTADGKIVTFYEDDSPGPTGQVTGDLWVDTTGGINRLHRWSGTEWIDVQDADIAQALSDAGQALSDAATALEVADGEITGWYQTSEPVIGGSPAQAHFGDIWIDTTSAPNLDTDDIHRCQDASGGSQGTLVWAHTPDNAIGRAYLAAYDAQVTADGKIVTFYEDNSPGPTGQVEGDLWVDTTGGANRLYRWDGDSWVDVQDADIAQALEDAGDALIQVGNLQEIIDGEIVGWFQDDEPVVGGSPDYAKYGDIWIDTNYPGGVDEDAIFRCQDPSGGSQGVLDWYNAPTNAIGLAYLAAYNANLVAGDKITTFYQDAIPTSENIGDLWVDTDDDNKLYRAASAGANEIAVGEWVLIRDQGITDALYDLYDENGLLSYFGITDTTLIDGNKVMTGGVLVDYLLSGLSAAGSPKAFNIASDAYDTIDVGLSTHIREVRSTASTGIWPALAYKMKYKIQVSVDGTNYSYIRGTSGAYAELLKMTYTDRDSVVHDTPIVFILEGNYVRYIRITFGGYYKQNNDAVSGNLACDFQAYGAMAYIDGGTLLAQTLLLGSFETSVQTTLSNADDVYDAGALDVITNFNGRNDRIAVTPATPDTLNITRELNTDGTSNLNFSWSF